jgi:hypothetical protein
VKGGAIYHVVNANGQLVNRVIAPPGRVVVGFGADGTVFMGVSEDGIAHLERVRLK